MKIELHPHAIKRLIERGASEEDVVDTVQSGEHFHAKHGRSGYRKTFIFNDYWNGIKYYAKQIECYTVTHDEKTVVISLLVKYF